MIGLTWVAFLLRTATLANQSLWRDEVDAIRFSGWPLSELLAGLFRTGHNGPLFFLLLRPWRFLTGDSEFALRYPAALWGALAVPLGYLLARQLGFNRWTGFLASLLLATSPYLIWYGQEAKMYTLLLILVTLAFIAYLRALSGAGIRWWLVFIVATTLSFYIHVLAPLMLLVYVAVAWLYHDRVRRQWRGWVISLTCLTLPYLPLAIWQLPLLLANFHSGHPFYPLAEQFHLLLQLYSRGLIRFGRWTPLVLYIFLFLAGLVALPAPTGPKSPPRRSRYLLALWVLLPALTVNLISRRVAVFEDRYLIYIAPPFYLLIAVGLNAIRRYWRGLAALSLGLILMLNLLGIWQQQRQPIKADFRAVAHYLLSQPQLPDTIMIQMPYLQYTLNYYYPDTYTLLEGLWTNDGKNEAAVQAEMAALTAGLTDLWLVVSEEAMWDNRGLTRAWLNQHADLVDEAHFMRVDVYHYRLKPGLIDQPAAARGEIRN